MRNKRIIPITEKHFSSELDPHNFKFIYSEFRDFAKISAPHLQKEVEDLPPNVPIKAHTHLEPAREEHKILSRDVPMEPEEQITTGREKDIDMDDYDEVRIIDANQKQQHDPSIARGEDVNSQTNERELSVTHKHKGI